VTRRRSKTRLRAAVAGVVLLALNLLIFGAFTWPRLTRVRRAEDRALEVSTRKASLEGLWGQMVARQELVARNRKDIETLRRDYLKSRTEDLFAAQREIEKLARDSGLRPKRSSYALEEIKGTGLVRCEVLIPLEGSYAGLTSFLDRIEGARRFIVVDQMALAEDEQGARMNLKLSVVFKDGDSRATP
jgi:Tfp pilus assembly protein PilO